MRLSRQVAAVGQYGHAAGCEPSQLILALGAVRCGEICRIGSGAAEGAGAVSQPQQPSQVVIDHGFVDLA
jgi:hypothetical protein